jgi:hypothetical protein
MVTHTSIVFSSVDSTSTSAQGVSKTFYNKTLEGLPIWIFFYRNEPECIAECKIAKYFIIPVIHFLPSKIAHKARVEIESSYIEGRFQPLVVTQQQQFTNEGFPYVL